VIARAALRDQRHVVANLLGAARQLSHRFARVLLGLGVTSQSIERIVEREHRLLQPQHERLGQERHPPAFTRARSRQAVEKSRRGQPDCI
jgi:hypothetical protein